MSQLRVAPLLVFLLLLSACGEEQVTSDLPASVSTTVTEQPVTDGSEDLAAQAEEFSAFLERTEWQIVERSGFATNPIDGRVRFDVLEGNPIVAFNTMPCQSGGLAAIEWNDNGFKIVVLPEEQLSVFLGTEGESCEPPDDLLGLLIFGLNDDQFNVEIAEDRETVLLRKGAQSLTLISAPSASSAEPPASSTTTTAATTTTVG